MNAIRRERRDVHGIVLLDKPVGITSNAALQRAKRIFHARKAGHTGSLDPLASGLLPICMGEATKVSAYLLDARKRYTVTASVGARTTTGDAEGDVVDRSDVRINADQLEMVLGDFRCEIEQVPPMYSAL
ncbi:MAG: tRNA pseudouridine(55) synthase TruB, partial [Gammaproteobacteria bacterium]|nr:tRNA pseudouridine(55) synthase TruB [Gammaproteobacteria bacterium]